MGLKRRAKGLGTLQREKNGTYTIRAFVAGKPISKSTRLTNKEDAEKYLREYMRPIAGNDTERMYDTIQALIESDDARHEREEDEKPQLKLADAWEVYRDSPLHRDLASSTLEGKRIVWSAFVKWMDDKAHDVIEVRGVKPAHIELFLKEMREGHAASTYNNRVCVLREMFRVIMPKARAKVNPFDGVKLLTDDAHTRRELTIEELQRLISCAARYSDEYRKLFGIGIYTGLRLGDCCNLNWKNVDVVRSIIQVIPKKTAKYAHGKPVTIPIHPTLSLMFQETPVEDRNGYVLPNIQAYYAKRRSKVSNHIKRIFNDAGIVTSVNVEGRTHKAPEATFHSFRHTFVSLSANAGVPLHIVQSIVGHESTAMTRHYYHENEKALRQAVSAIPTIGETLSKGAIFNMNRIANMAATGVEYFPGETQGIGYVEPAPVVEAQPAAVGVRPPVVPLAEQLNPPAPKPEWQTMKPEDVRGDFAKSENAVTPEVLPPEEKKPVVIPEGAKVEIREFGRVYVDGVATGGRIGGVQARPRPPKQAWFGQVYYLWSRRRHLGVLEGTMDLISNGGQKFLTQLWERNTVQDPAEAIDICEAYLKGRGVLV